MSLIRNSSPYPVKLASYQIDKTKFGKDGDLIYPGECRYIKAEEFDWDACIIAAFTKDGVIPGKVNIDISINIPNCPIGLNIHINESTAMAGAIIGKHSFFEFKMAEDKSPIFVENESLDQSTGCRVCHGW